MLTYEQRVRLNYKQKAQRWLLKTLGIWRIWYRKVKLKVQEWIREVLTARFWYIFVIRLGITMKEIFLFILEWFADKVVNMWAEIKRDWKRGYKEWKWYWFTAEAWRRDYEGTKANMRRNWQEFCQFLAYVWSWIRAPYDYAIWYYKYAPKQLLKPFFGIWVLLNAMDFYWNFLFWITS
jgi:hypothetical protein